jgi:hypothetical protein
MYDWKRSGAPSSCSTRRTGKPSSRQSVWGLKSRN